MRVSCNGCRALRKGCSDDCSLRPCLQWIKSPESQAHATVFLAKFYGRAGLMNLINSGPHHLRPAVFRSLLYEACGRIVNPIYGSVGLLWSGSWQLCQSAVESVLGGAAITPIPSEAAAAPVPPLKAYDIRHVSKGPGGSRPTSDLHKVSVTARSPFKRPGAGRAGPHPCRAPLERATSREPSASHATETVESLHSAETAEASQVSQGGPAEESDVELELTLGFEPAGRTSRPARPAPVAGRCEIGRRGDDTCHDDLGLELHA